jgi:DNA-binding transcriptional ArsR family regulator
MHVPAMINGDGRARRILACLGHRSRFRVVATLLSGDQCVTDLAGQIGLSQSCTTRHLQVLQREGIVEGARSGKRVVFRLCVDEPWITSLIAWALNAPKGAEELPAEGTPPPSSSSRKSGGDVSGGAEAPGVALHGPVVVGGSAFESYESGRETGPEDRKRPSETGNRDDLEDFLL